MREPTCEPADKPEGKLSNDQISESNSEPMSESKVVPMREPNGLPKGEPRLKLVDAHIHLDLYEPNDMENLLAQCAADECVAGLIAVSMHLASCQSNEKLAERWPGFVHPAYGYHPEQLPLTDSELDELIGWIRSRAGTLIAIGEVGLPYYSRQEAIGRGEAFDIKPYTAMLERFLALADELDKPVVLHAVYEDADIACDLLANYPRARAHFHWFKGSEETVQRMIKRGYSISVTPDVLYEEEIQWLARRYPLELLMVETDGPWPFEGPFEGMLTKPMMILESINAVAALKGLPMEVTAEHLFGNTLRFYRLTFNEDSLPTYEG